MTDLHTITDADLAANMALLEGWEERYSYLIELGRSLPTMPADLKTDAHLVRGCTSQVWLVPQEATQDAVRFWADSDAHIVKGLIAVLYIVFDGQPADKIRRFDVDAYFRTLGLAEHLTPNRRNGFFAMVERLRALV